MDICTAEMANQNFVNGVSKLYAGGLICIRESYAGRQHACGSFIYVETTNTSHSIGHQGQNMPVGDIIVGLSDVTFNDRVKSKRRMWHTVLPSLGI